MNYYILQPPKHETYKYAVCRDNKDGQAIFIRSFSTVEAAERHIEETKDE